MPNNMASIKTALMKCLASKISQPPYSDAQSFLLSVSGGMDSMVLLDVFRTMDHVHGVPLRVVHFHHGTGSFADQAQALVESYCNKYKIPVTLCNYTQRPGNFEYEAARFRREMLAGMCGDNDRVVLAHHLQDQAETCIQTLARGAGISTPLGMVEAHGNRLRPFLPIHRNVIADHAELCKVPHLLDPTNYNVGNFRNSVRHEVLPKLNTFHQNTSARIAGFAAELHQLRQDLHEVAEGLFVQSFQEQAGLLPRSVFEKNPRYLWDFILRCFWQKLGMPRPKRKEQQQLRNWLINGDIGNFHHSGLLIWCDSDGLIAEAAPEKKPQQGVFGQTIQWGPWMLKLSAGSTAETTFRLMPARKHEKDLKEHLRSQRVPHRMRHNLPVLIVGNQERPLLEWILKEGPESFGLEAIHPPQLLTCLRGELKGYDSG